MIDAQYDVVVVGAGLAGSGLAAMLGQAGWKTLLLDKELFPRHKVCGEFLSPEARGVLDRLGLLPAVRMLNPQEIHTVRLISAGGRLLEMALQTPAWGISRYALDRFLLTAAGENGADVCTGVTVTAVRTGTEGYELDLRRREGSSTIRARAVIGAWGRNPRIGLLRRNPTAAAPTADGQGWVGIKTHLAASVGENGTVASAFAEEYGKAVGTTATVCEPQATPLAGENWPSAAGEASAAASTGNGRPAADGGAPAAASTGKDWRAADGEVPAAASTGNGRPAADGEVPAAASTGKDWRAVDGGTPASHAVELYFFPGGYMGLCPVEGNRINAAALLTGRAFRAAGQTPIHVLAAAARANPALSARLEPLSPLPASVKSVSPVRISTKPCAWSLVPHIGDAAAVIPPLCGDGMAMALRSAELCGRLTDLYLRGRLSADQWRSRYSRQLYAEWSGPLFWGRLAQHLLCREGLAPLSFRLGAGMPGMVRKFWRLTRLKETPLNVL